MNVRLIKTKADHEAALKRIDEIFDACPGTVEGEELELLLHLVEEFEAVQYPIAMPDPIDAIKFRMEQQGLKQADLVPYIGSKSKVSEVLNRKRPLSLAMIRKLHDGLGIPADVLVQKPGAEVRDNEPFDTAHRKHRAVAESRAKYGRKKS
jgi:HTH-type transcriptional regulator / antitoxin HigA